MVKIRVETPDFTKVFKMLFCFWEIVGFSYVQLCMRQIDVLLFHKFQCIWLHLSEQ